MMRRITGAERRWFIAMVETILPSRASESFPLGASDVPLSSFLDDFLRHAPTKIVIGLRATLLLIFVAPLFMSGLRRTFSGLNAEQREAAILRMRRSDAYIIRELPVLLKTIGCMAVLGVPSVQRALGLAAVDDTPPDWARGAEDSAMEGARVSAAPDDREEALETPEDGLSTPVGRQEDTSDSSEAGGLPAPLVADRATAPQGG